MKAKRIKILIMILIIVIVLLGGIFAYLYFATDVLKTNQQLFFQYLGQLGANEEGFLDNNLTAYFEKKKTGKYQDSGKFYVDINMSNVDTDMLSTVNDFNIEYSGQIDNTARKNEQDISINYSNDVNFPIKYKYTNETVGLQTDYVSSKYIGIENSNLKEFAEKLGITDTESIPDSIDFYAQSENENIFNFTEEEKEQIISTYKTIIEEKLANKEFGKTEENGVTNYSVEITNQEAKDLILACLEKLKTDTILLPKIEEALEETLTIANQSSTEEITVQDVIQEYIDNLNEAEVQEGTSIITVSQMNKMLTGITVQIEESELKITKTNTQGILTYTIEINAKDTESEDNVRYFMSASYQGLEQLTSVNETYQFGIIGTIDGTEQKMVYNLNCTDTFKDTINIENFGEDEIQTLNEYDGEQLATLMMNIGERIEQVNSMQMEQIGFSEYGNPMLYAFPLTSMPILIYNQASDAIDESSMSEVEMSTFNSKFTQYEGVQSGTTVKSLLQTILSNNMVGTDENRKVEVSGVVTMTKDDTEAPTGEINSGSRYNVEIQYNEGLVSEVVITEQ